MCPPPPSPLHPTPGMEAPDTPLSAFPPHPRLSLPGLPARSDEDPFTAGPGAGEPMCPLGGGRGARGTATAGRPLSRPRCPGRGEGALSGAARTRGLERGRRGRGLVASAGREARRGGARGQGGAVGLERRPLSSRHASPGKAPVRPLSARPQGGARPPHRTAQLSDTAPSPHSSPPPPANAHPAAPPLCAGWKSQSRTPPVYSPTPGEATRPDPHSSPSPTPARRPSP